MSNLPGLIQQGLFFGFFITVSCALLSAVFLRPLFPRMNSRLAPATRATLLTFLGAFPLLAALGILFLALLPSLLQVLEISSDHCLGHPEGHIHFCLVHGHPVIDSWLVWAPALAFAAALVVVPAHLVLDVLRIRHFRRLLLARPLDTRMAADVCVLDVKTPLAVSCGLLKPSVYLSTGLLENLSDEETTLVIHHERAHIERHDGLRQWLVRGFSMMHFPPIRRRLLRELDLACEQASDGISASTGNNPDMLATLLLKIERLYQAYFPTGNPLAPSVTGSTSNLEDRIRYLLVPARCLPVSSHQLLGTMLLCVFFLLVSHDVVHDWLEHLLSFVVARYV